MNLCGKNYDKCVPEKLLSLACFDGLVEHLGQSRLLMGNVVDMINALSLGFVDNGYGFLQQFGSLIQLVFGNGGLKLFDSGFDLATDTVITSFFFGGYKNALLLRFDDRHFFLLYLCE